MSQLRVGNQALDQVEASRVEPLHIVEEQDERLPRPREHAEKSATYQLEAALRIRDLWNRWLLTDDERSSGIKLTRSCPFWPSASCNACRQVLSAASSLLS